MAVVVWLPPVANVVRRKSRLLDKMDLVLCLMGCRPMHCGLVDKCEEALWSGFQIWNAARHSSRRGSAIVLLREKQNLAALLDSESCIRARGICRDSVQRPDIGSRFTWKALGSGRVYCSKRILV